MKPPAQGRLALESAADANTAHHVLDVHQGQPQTAGDVIEGFGMHGDAYLIGPDESLQLLAGLGACVRLHKVNRATRMLQRVPILGAHIHTYPEESRRMLREAHDVSRDW